MLHAWAWSGFGTFMMFLFASMVLVCFMIFAKDKGSSGTISIPCSISVLESLYAVAQHIAGAGTQDRQRNVHEGHDGCHFAVCMDVIESYLIIKHLQHNRRSWMPVQPAHELWSPTPRVSTYMQIFCKRIQSMHVVRLRFSKGITAPLKTLQELNTQLIGMQCVAVEQAPTRQLTILKFPSFQVLDPTVAQCFAGIKRMSC